jgi:hypothetical protein
LSSKATNIHHRTGTNFSSSYNAKNVLLVRDTRSHRIFPTRGSYSFRALLDRFRRWRSGRDSGTPAPVRSLKKRAEQWLLRIEDR